MLQPHHTADFRHSAGLPVRCEPWQMQINMRSSRRGSSFDGPNRFVVPCCIKLQDEIRSDVQ